MLDYHKLKNDFSNIVIKMENRIDGSLLKKWSDLEAKKHHLQQEIESLRQKRKQQSKEIGKLLSKPETKPQGEAAKSSVKELGEQLSTLENEINQIAHESNDLSLRIPNIPSEKCPKGKNEEDNIFESMEGEIPNIESPLDHTDLGTQKGILCFDKAAKLSGSRFSVLAGDGARLENALTQFMLDEQRNAGYTQVSLPVIVNRETLTTSGNLPKFEEDLYHLGNDLFLIPTSEPPLVNLFRDEIIDYKKLPIKLCSFTPCFRKEAGSYGKDTRGMIRQHQFLKVELVSICEAHESEKIHEKMIQDASNILRKLKLPFRRMLLCDGDMGFQANLTVDLEVWLPSEGRYREISSVSNCGDFQARRGQIRYKKGGEKKTTLLHTLNGSGLAVGRCWLAIIENYQKEDGTIEIPEVLQKYMDGQKQINSNNLFL